MNQKGSVVLDNTAGPYDRFGDNANLYGGSGLCTFQLIGNAGLKTTETIKNVRTNFWGGLLVKGGTLNATNTVRLGSGPISVTDSGVIRLAYSYSGTVPISLTGGTLRADYLTGSQPLINPNAAIDFPTGYTGTIFAEDTTSYYANSLGAITGSGTLRKIGLNTYNTGDRSQIEFTLATGNSDSFTGNILVEQGRMKVGAPAYWPKNVGTVTIQPGATMWFHAPYYASGGLPGYMYNFDVADDKFAGGGTLMTNASLDGTSELEYLRVANSGFAPSGTTTSQAGILKIISDLILNTTTRNSQTVYNTFAMDLLHGTGNSAQPVAGVDYDQIAVKNSLTNLAYADLSVNLAAKMNFLGNVLTIVTSGNVLSGTLHSVNFNLTGFADVAVGGTTTGTTRGWVTLSNITYAGDANRDGKVDMTDYQVWFADFGMTFAPGLNNANWQLADFTGDGQVDMADYQLWFANFGDDQGTNPVPEPATLALLALGLPLLRRRRR